MTTGRRTGVCARRTFQGVAATPKPFTIQLGREKKGKNPFSLHQQYAFNLAFSPSKPSVPPSPNITTTPKSHIISPRNLGLMISHGKESLSCPRCDSSACGSFRLRKASLRCSHVSKGRDLGAPGTSFSRWLGQVSTKPRVDRVTYVSNEAGDDKKLRFGNKRGSRRLSTAEVRLH